MTVAAHRWRRTGLAACALAAGPVRSGEPEPDPGSPAGAREAAAGTSCDARHQRLSDGASPGVSQ